jgi:hypothetical protein
MTVYAETVEQTINLKNDYQAMTCMRETGKTGRGKKLESKQAKKAAKEYRQARQNRHYN